MKSLKEIYSYALRINDDELLDKLAEASIVCRYDKGDTLIQVGETPQMLFSLVRGILRCVTPGEKGREVTLSIYRAPGQWVMPNAEIWTPATSAIEALTNCTVAAIPVMRVMELEKEYPQMASAHSEYIARQCDILAELHSALGQNTAIGRYEWFIKTHPDLVDKLSDKVIASYLSITPVTLSRARRGVRERRQSK